MMKRMMKMGSAGLGLVIVLLLTLPAFAEDAPRLTEEQVKEMLGKADVVVIDVRAGGVKPGELKIAGAVVEDPKKVADWAKKFPKSNRLVLYCA